MSTKDNIPWLLTNGLHCPNARVFHPDYVNIGNRDLIDKRTRRQVPVAPGGTLSDYVPFYFTPYTPMLLNIKTGRNGVIQRDPREIVIMITSIHKLAVDGRAYLFTDRHAYLNAADFYSDPADLADKIDCAFCNGEIFNATTTISKNLSDIRQRRSCTNTYQSRGCSESPVTMMKLRRTSMKLWEYARSICES